MRGKRTVMFAVMAGLIVGALVVFGLQLRGSQETSRDDLRDRFADATANNAALTHALFGSTAGTTSDELAAAFGGDISQEELDKRIEEGRSPYGMVVDENGGILASSGKLPPGTPERMADVPAHIASALGAPSFGLSNAVEMPGGTDAFEYSNGFDAQDGSRRAFVSAIDPVILTSFLGSYLNETRRLDGGEAYITDARGVIVAATQGADRPLDPSLMNVALEEGAGDYGDDRYYSTSAIEGTSWLVLSTVPNEELLSAVSGSSAWVPWLIFVFFAAAAGVAFTMSLRAVADADRLRLLNQRLERTNEELEHRALELQRSNEELEQFASIASHDLSEPLRKVQMFSMQLQASEADRLSEKGSDYIERMIEAGERMQRLIEDLLEFSRVTTRGRPFVSVDLGEIFRDAVSDLEAPLVEAGGKVEVGDLPTVEADPLQIRQLAQNLVSNAIKFRQEGIPPVVRVSGEVRAGKARVEVADNGIGFDPRYAMRIFRVFERLHGRTSYPGTGIGLALCRKIAERHGGGIVAQSTPGEGATFTVTLPVRQFRAPKMNGSDPEALPDAGTEEGQEVAHAIS